MPEAAQKVRGIEVTIGAEAQAAGSRAHKGRIGSLYLDTLLSRS